MTTELILQGRRIGQEDIVCIEELMSSHPQWSRRRLSEALCQQWDWRNGQGRYKDMAARSLLNKLAERAMIALPPRRCIPCNRMAQRERAQMDWDLGPVESGLGQLGVLQVREISQDDKARRRFAAALAEFHYLGYRGTVGENLQYEVSDADGRLLACLLFGSAAWKCQARDQYIGWTAEQRTRNLHLLTNNTRFLILPMVRVAHLASWILGRVLRRLSADWQKKYGHPIRLVETFVEQQRFTGTSYRAANWIRIGATQGRSRQDRQHRVRVPIKDVYLYPLSAHFRRELAA